MFLFSRWSAPTLTNFIKGGGVQGCWLGENLKLCSVHSYNQLDHTTSVNFFEQMQIYDYFFWNKIQNPIFFFMKNKILLVSPNLWKEYEHQLHDLLWHGNYKLAFQFLLNSSYLIFFPHLLELNVKTRTIPCKWASRVGASEQR